MIKISIKMGSVPTDNVEEVFSDKRMSNGMYANQTLSQIFMRKFANVGKTQTSIKKFMEDFISNADEVFYSTLSLNKGLTFRKAKTISEKYKIGVERIEPWNKIEGVSFIFKKGDKVLSVSINAILVVASRETHVIFDVFNIEMMDDNKLDPVEYGYKKTNERFMLTDSPNSSRELYGWVPASFFKEVSEYSKNFRATANDRIKSVLSLEEWSQWANVLAAYASNSKTATIFGLKEKEFSSGELVEGFVFDDNDWKGIKGSTRGLENTVSVLSSDSNDIRVIMTEGKKTTIKNLFEKEVVSPFKKEIKKAKDKIIVLNDSVKSNAKEKVSIEDEIASLKELLSKKESELNGIPEFIDKKVKVKGKKGKEDAFKITTETNPTYTKVNSELNKLGKDISNSNKELMNNAEALKIIINTIEKTTSNMNFSYAKLERVNGEIKEFVDKTSSTYLYKVSFEFKSKVADQRFYLPSFKEEFDGNVSVSDIGSIRLSSRILKAKKKILSASYKNPFLLSSFLNIGKESLTSNKNIVINKDGWEFNEGQLKAIGKMDANKSTFFLQGPPGTGKTTTISRFAEMQATKDKQILMTSSTKAAITGFIESVEEMSGDNPNIFAILNIPFSEREEETRYKSDTLYKRHMNKIFKQSNSNVKVKISDSFLNDLKEIITEQDLIDIRRGKVTEALCQKSIGRRVKMSLRDFDSLSKNAIEEVCNKLKENEDFISIERQNELNTAIKAGVLSYTNGVFEKSETSSSHNSLKGLVVNKLSKFKRESLPEDVEQKFNASIISFGLINIIAQTNTSRLSLETISGVKDLKIDFDIDTVIIDEVSKSITLEVLRMASNAKRAVFAGDYRQLPPDNNYDKDTLAEMYFDITNNWEKIRKSNIFIWPGGDLKEDTQETYKLFENYYDLLMDVGPEEFKRIIKSESKERADKLAVLYDDSLFKTSMITAIKKPKKLSNYEILKESRRFNNSILEVVNTFYDGKEKLVSFPGIGKTKKGTDIKFKAFGKEHSGSEVYWVDTSYVSDKGNFKTLIKKAKPKGDKYISYNVKRDFSPLMNEFNASVCVEVIESLIDGGVNQEDIGVISLNSGQKKMIKGQLKAKFPGVVVETIGWFQGREKDVIITDFVWASYALDSKGLRKRGIDNTSFASYERINVGVSRARKLLINIGAYDSYIKDITGRYIYSNGKVDNEYPYIAKMMDSIESVGKVVKDEN